MSQKRLCTVKDDIEEISLKYHRIFSKPVDRSFVSRDFLRLANKFIVSIEDNDGSVTKRELFAPEVDAEQIVRVLNELSVHVDTKEKQKLLTVEKLMEYVRNLQEHESFGRFLSSFYREESNVVKVLKCCSQTYIVLFLGSLGVHLYNACKLRAKDTRGSWNLIITKNPKTGILSVTHRRTEEAVRQSVSGGKLEVEFQFTWEITMRFTKDMTHFSSIKAKVIDIKWKKEENREIELEEIFLSVFSEPIVDNLTIEKLTMSVEELKKKKTDLGPLRFIPEHIVVTKILVYMNPKELLTILATVNSTFFRFSTSDDLWSIIILESNRMMRINLLIKPFYSFYGELFTYWRLEEPPKGTIEKRYYSLIGKKKNNNNIMLLTTKKGKKFKDQKSIKPIMTSNLIDRSLPQLFRVHLKNGVVSGCGIGICSQKNGLFILDYHADGSISRSDPNRITVDNRIQEIEKEDGSKKQVRVILPLEKDFVFNIFVDNENRKVHFFFNEDFNEKISCTIARELLEQDLRFGVKINAKQEIEVLPSVNMDFPYPTRKKIKRIY